MKAMWLVVLTASLAMGQAAKAPEIKPELASRFFKAQVQMLAAQATFQQAQTDLQNKQGAFLAAAGALTEACGKEFDAQLDKAGDPVCVAKPPVAPAPTPTKKP